MSARGSLILVSALMMLAGSLFLPATVGAQTRNDLQRRIERLELDLRELQRRMFTQDDRSRPATGAPSTPETASGGRDGPVAQSWAKRAIIRLQQLEDQMRNLNGRVAEVQFALTRETARIDHIETEMQRRAPAAMTALGPNIATAVAADTVATEIAANSSPAPTVASNRLEVTPGAPGHPEAGRMRDRGAAQTDAPPQPAPATDPPTRYKQAFALLMKHDYPAAESAFQGFVETFSDNPLAGNAMYWLGETHYVREQYAEAATAFATGYEKYANSPKAPDNLLKLALALARMQRIEDACVALTQFHHQFPKAQATLKRRAMIEEKRINCAN